jgi:hypothetical protein
VIAPDGATAAHTQTFGDPGIDEQIIASDSAGMRVLDSGTEPLSSPMPLLTRLTLAGYTLTWDHDGSPRTAQLH